MVIAESLEAQTRREVASIVCPVDQHEKVSGSPLCCDCWRALPDSLRCDLSSTPFAAPNRPGLITSVNSDYAVLLEECKEWLAREKRR